MHVRRDVQVRVRVDEAGHDRLAGEVHDVRARDGICTLPLAPIAVMRNSSTTMSPFSITSLDPPFIVTMRRLRSTATPFGIRSAVTRMRARRMELRLLARPPRPTSGGCATGRIVGLRHQRRGRIRATHRVVERGRAIEIVDDVRVAHRPVNGLAVRPHDGNCAPMSGRRRDGEVGAAATRAAAATANRDRRFSAAGPWDVGDVQIIIHLC